MAETTTARTPHRRRGAAPIGAIFILMAVIGLVSVLAVTVHLTKNFVDNTARKTEFENLIRPVLMFDPVPYENPNDLDPAVLLQASMWSALLGEKRGSYQYDEMKMLIVPASDLDVNALKLFGPDVKLKHQSFGNYETSFVYDEETKTYRVPVVAQTGTYTPRIEKIIQKGDTVQLLVGYIPPDTLWTAEQAQRKDGEVQPDKYMVYVLKKYKKEYYISAIRDVAGAGLPGGDYSGSEVVIPNLLPGNSLVDAEGLSALEAGQSGAESGQSGSAGAQSSGSSAGD